MLASPPDDVQAALEMAVRAVTSVAGQLPTAPMVEEVQQQVQGAVERGYFLPNEDEQVRALFSQYLRTRAALLNTLEELRPRLLGPGAVDTEDRPRIFAVAFCIACMLMRSGRYLIESFGDQPTVWKKLDEAEPRFGIPRKQFTKVFKSLSSPRNNWIFLTGIRYADTHAAELQALQADPVVGEVARLLQSERPFIEASRQKMASRRLRYRLHAFLRRNVSGWKQASFALFRLSGSVISEIRMRWKRKRVTAGVRRKVSRILKPGDVLVTRHDDAASNLFLPGFWPHAALYIGTEEERSAMGVTMDDDRQRRSRAPVCVLEAKKDGVLFRELDETLAVDAFVVLRPNLQTSSIRDAITRAVTHEGKGYDFEFDFRRSDKLVCTEVVYRAFHDDDKLQFELKPRVGRFSLSAEDILDRSLDSEDFDVIAIYGVGGNRFRVDELAESTLRQSYRSND